MYYLNTSQLKGFCALRGHAETIKSNSLLFIVCAFSQNYSSSNTATTASVFLTDTVNKKIAVVVVREKHADLRTANLNYLMNNEHQI